MKRAVCRIGDWRLCPQYSDLEMSQEEWLAMSSDAKKTHLQSVVSSFETQSSAQQDFHSGRHRQFQTRGWPDERERESQTLSKMLSDK